MLDYMNMHTGAAADDGADAAADDGADAAAADDGGEPSQGSKKGSTCSQQLVESIESIPPFAVPCRSSERFLPYVQIAISRQRHEPKKRNVDGRTKKLTTHC